MDLSLSSQQAVKRACTNIILNSEFFAVILLKLKVSEVPKEYAEKYDTMCTDGKFLWYHPVFVSKMSQREIIGVLIHELLHCAFMHPFRMSTRRDPHWGWATDFSINPIVKKDYQIPEPHLDEVKYHNMSAEEIYDDLVKNNPPMPPDLLDIGQVVPCGTLSKDVANSEMGAEELDWKAAVAQAASASRKAGTLPAGLEQLVDSILKPQIPWREILYKFLSNTVPGRIDWSRRANRSKAVGFHLPKRHKVKRGSFVIAIDTSGSFSDRECEIALSEIAFIVNEMKPVNTIVIQCDTEIKGKPKVYEDGDDFPTKVQIVGRGGTDFRPPFMWLKQHPEIDVDAFIYLTDGYGPFPEEQEFPVLWAITNKDVTPPFGEHLYLQID